MTRTAWVAPHIVPFMAEGEGLEPPWVLPRPHLVHTCVGSTGALTSELIAPAPCPHVRRLDLLHPPGNHLVHTCVGSTPRSCGYAWTDHTSGPFRHHDSGIRQKACLESIPARSNSEHDRTAAARQSPRIPDSQLFGPTPLDDC